MPTHSITFNLTTDQVEHLNIALNDIHDANNDAINSSSFSDDETIPLLRQCEALDVLTKSIKSILSKPNHA